MGYIPFKNDYLNMPVITRLYLTLCLFMTVSVQFGVISLSQIHFNHALIFKNYEFHRLLANVLFLGYLGFNWVFQYVLLYKYCKKMEESFEGRNIDFVCMLLFNGAFITIASSYFELAFIGQSFVMMFAFIWSRRFRKNEVDLFGIVQYPAYLLPWIIMLFFVLLGNPIILDLIGIGSGLTYILIEDVLSPKLGFRILHIPGISFTCGKEFNTDFEKFLYSISLDSTMLLVTNLTPQTSHINCISLFPGIPINIIAICQLLND